MHGGHNTKKKEEYEGMNMYVQTTHIIKIISECLKQFAQNHVSLKVLSSHINNNYSHFGYITYFHHKLDEKTVIIKSHKIM